MSYNKTSVSKTIRSLQLVGDDLWSPSEDNVTVVDAGRHENIPRRLPRIEKVPGCNSPWVG